MTPRRIVDTILRVVWPDRERAYRGLRGVGQRWERVAEKRLKAEGYVIRERNFRARAGEIDFIADEKGVLCFIEVKARGSLRFGTPAEAVTAEKQRRIVRAAEEYLQKQRLGRVPCRFDVVSILDSADGAAVTILRDAFASTPRG